MHLMSSARPGWHWAVRRRGDNGADRLTALQSLVHNTPSGRRKPDTASCVIRSSLITTPVNRPGSRPDGQNPLDSSTPDTTTRQFAHIARDPSFAAGTAGRQRRCSRLDRPRAGLRSVGRRTAAVLRQEFIRGERHQDPAPRRIPLEQLKPSKTIPWGITATNWCSCFVRSPAIRTCGSW